MAHLGGSRDAESEVVADPEEPGTPKSPKTPKTPKNRKNSDESRTATTVTSILSSPTVATKTSGASGESRNPFSSSNNTAWIFFVAAPDVAAFSVTARDAGIVQTSFNATWRIVDYCGSGGCADVYRAKGDGNIQAAVKIPKQPLTSQTQVDAEKSWSSLSKEVRAMRALRLSP